MLITSTVKTDGDVMGAVLLLAQARGGARVWLLIQRCTASG